MIQMPTAIYMVSGFMNSLRIVYLDGRPHTDPDIVVRTLQRRVDRPMGRRHAGRRHHGFRRDHHWMDQEAHPFRPANSCTSSSVSA